MRGIRMRLVRLEKDIEFPERNSSKDLVVYENIRSNMRIDARPEETVLISTGLRLDYDPEKYKVFINNLLDGSVMENPPYNEELCVETYNETAKTKQIYRGQVIARLEAERIKEDEDEDISGDGGDGESDTSGDSEE
jgi:dUTPase